MTANAGEDQRRTLEEFALAQALRRQTEKETEMSTSPDNNDEYDVSQQNGMIDVDGNANVGTLTQTGGAQFAGIAQGIASGSNQQGNNSAIVNFGADLSSGQDNTDLYSVDQTNNMFDLDGNANVATVTQLGGANLAGVEQAIGSGGNSQSNTSGILDEGVSLSRGNDNNDQYAVVQLNGLADLDTNVQIGTIGQNSSGPATGLFAGIDQDIVSGGNSQSNTSNILDAGLDIGCYTGHGSNDVFAVEQTNNLYDNDGNANVGTIVQGSGVNFAAIDQNIVSGGNSQSNASSILDDGFALNGGSSNNDAFAVTQLNGMDDGDTNINIGGIAQSGFASFAGIDQDVESGGNEQSNSSEILDVGIADYWGGSGSNNDNFTVVQTNLLFDNDVNLNVGIVGQVGNGNFAGIDQNIVSGGNSQSNASSIADTGLALDSVVSNDEYDLTQTNFLLDNDANANSGTVTQLVGPANFAGLDQDIASGGNTQGNTSDIADIGV